MAYEQGWVVSSFDWSEWGNTRQARQLMGGAEAISSATIEELEKLLTFFIRADRFNEGFLAKRFDDGTLLKICPRAKSILDAT